MKNTPAPSAAAGAGGTAAPGGGGRKQEGQASRGGERSSQMDSHCCNVPGKFQREKSSPGNHEMVPFSQKSPFFTPKPPQTSSCSCPSGEAMTRAGCEQPTCHKPQTAQVRGSRGAAITFKHSFFPLSPTDITALRKPLRCAPPFGCGHRQPQVTGRRNPEELTPAPLRDRQHGAELCPKSLCQNSRSCRTPVPAPLCGSAAPAAQRRARACG